MAGWGRCRVTRPTSAPTAEAHATAEDQTTRMSSPLRRLARPVARRMRLEPFLDAGLRAARLVTEERRHRRWQARLGAWLRDGIELPTADGWAGRHDDGSVPLVMCLWNRPDRLPAVLAMLGRLDPATPVRLLLWNNNPDDAARYRAVVDAAPRGRGLASVDLYDSPVNIGGLARFVAIRLLHNGGHRGPVVMLDDDQDVTPSFVRDLLDDYAPRSVVAWWAFSQHGSYWARAEIAPGDPADHAGTGGTVLDPALVADDRFFARLPRRFAFLEDQWMSFVAHRLGWRVVKADTHVDLVSEELNQYHRLKPLKDVFHAEQLRRGGGLLGPPLRRRAWDRGRVRSASRR